MSKHIAQCAHAQKKPHTDRERSSQNSSGYVCPSSVCECLNTLHSVHTRKKKPHTNRERSSQISSIHICSGSVCECLNKFHSVHTRNETYILTVSVVVKLVPDIFVLVVLENVLSGERSTIYVVI
jgi:hypothetical protein